MREHNSYFINVNFLPFPSNQALFSRAQRRAAEWKLRRHAFSWASHTNAIGPSHRPLLTHLLSSALAAPSQLRF